MKQFNEYDSEVQLKALEYVGNYGVTELRKYALDFLEEEAPTSVLNDYKRWLLGWECHEIERLGLTDQ